MQTPDDFKSDARTRPSPVVYINALGKCLPGEPISNDAMEDYIGRIHGQASRLGKFALKHNRIQQRHYAICPDGSTDWTVAKLQAAALNDALAKAEVLPRDITFLACATSQNDVLVPGIASMVHGESRLPPLEVASFQSVCASSIMAVKYGFLQLLSGEHRTAAITAGEFASRFFRPGHYERSRWLAQDAVQVNHTTFARRGFLLQFGPQPAQSDRQSSSCGRTDRRTCWMPRQLDDLHGAVQIRLFRLDCMVRPRQNGEIIGNFGKRSLQDIAIKSTTVRHEIGGRVSRADVQDIRQYAFAQRSSSNMQRAWAKRASS